MSKYDSEKNHVGCKNANLMENITIDFVRSIELADVLDLFRSAEM